MSLPPIAPIPPASIRLSVAPKEWEACLDAWLALANLSVGLPSKQFDTVSSDPTSLAGFLRSYYHELAHVDAGDWSFSGTKARELHRACFSVTARLLLAGFNESMFQVGFLSNLCKAHGRSAALARLLSSVWKRKDQALQKTMQSEKSTLLKQLDGASDQATVDALKRLARLLRTSPDVGAFYMTGSDFLDASMSSWSTFKDFVGRKSLITNIYFGLLSLVRVETRNISVLTDHLYSLKSQAQPSGNTDSLVVHLVTNTPLLSKIRQSIEGKSPDRLRKVLDSLETYRSPSIATPTRQKAHKVNKGKARAPQMDGELHMHRMSRVTQVLDLFPDLGSGFVLKLLDEYNDDVEQVTAHLLDESLPPHLQNLDRSEQAPIFDADAHSAIEHLAPRSTPPPVEAPYIPERRNVFDDDELDRLEFDTGRLHIGKKADATASSGGNKAAILSALAAFDSDDDERDDTYDVEDVGGTVDNTAPDGEPGPAAKVTQEENEMALFTTYKASPELFGRTFDVRRGQARRGLKAETGMSDEQIEGWAVMLQRDPKRLRRLEAQSGASAFDGQQSHLAPTAFRESAGNTETEDSDTPAGSGTNTPRGVGRGIPGRGRGGRGRGTVAGPSSDPSTANAQRRKEASKSSRANHDRRDQRAKKMARGGFAS